MHLQLTAATTQGQNPAQRYQQRIHDIANKVIFSGDLKKLTNHLSNLVNYMLVQTMQAADNPSLQPVNPIFSQNLSLILHDARNALLDDLNKIDYLLNPKLNIANSVLKVCFDRLIELAKNDGFIDYDERITANPDYINEYKDDPMVYGIKDLSEEKIAKTTKKREKKLFIQQILEKIMKHPNVNAELLAHMLPKTIFLYHTQQTALYIYKFCMQKPQRPSEYLRESTELRLFRALLQMSSHSLEKDYLFLKLQPVEIDIMTENMPVEIFKALVHHYLPFFRNHLAFETNKAFFDLIDVSGKYADVLNDLPSPPQYLKNLLASSANAGPSLKPTQAPTPAFCLNLPVLTATSQPTLNTLDDGWTKIDYSNNSESHQIPPASTTQPSLLLAPPQNPFTLPNLHTTLLGMSLQSSSFDIFKLELCKAQSAGNYKQYFNLVDAAFQLDTIQTPAQLKELYDIINSLNIEDLRKPLAIYKMIPHPQASIVQTELVQKMTHYNGTIQFDSGDNNSYLGAILKKKVLEIDVIHQIVNNLSDYDEQGSAVNWLHKLVQKIVQKLEPSNNQVIADLLWKILDVGLLYPNTSQRDDIYQKTEQTKNSAITYLKTCLGEGYQNALQHQINHTSFNITAMADDWNGTENIPKQYHPKLEMLTRKMLALEALATNQNFSAGSTSIYEMAGKGEFNLKGNPNPKFSFYL